MRRLGWILVFVVASAPAAFLACSDEPSPKGAWVDAYVEPEPEPEPDAGDDAGDAGDAGDADAGDADAAG